MATTSLWPIHNTGGQGVKHVLKKLVEYAENDEKTTEKWSEGASGISASAAMSSVMGYVARDEKVRPQDRGSSGGDDFTEGSMGVGPIQETSMGVGMVSDESETLTSEEENAAVKQVLDMLSDQGEGMRYVTGVNCSPEHAVEEMMITKNRWPDPGNRLLYHGYQSFSPGEVTPEQAHRIGVQMARDLWGDRFEVVVATHLDREHLHNHFVCNAISFLDGRKFIWDKEYPRMRKRSDELCRAEKLSVVEGQENAGLGLHVGAVWAESQGKPTVQSVVKEDVDCCILAASTLEEWMSLMRGKGYRIDDSGKYLRVFPYGHSKCIRLDRRFGEEYSLDGIAQQIAERGGKPERKEKTEEEAIREIYRELSIRGKRRYTPGGKPKGVQYRYIGFLYRIGYRKSPAQIARTHYLLREELTKLDRYIEESKFLIYEDITTLDELRERRTQDQAEINLLYRSKKSLERMLPVSDHREKASAEVQLSRINESIRKMRKNLRSEKAILKRMGEMDAKEKKVEMALAGKSLGRPYRRNQSATQQLMNRRERSNQYG